MPGGLQVEKRAVQFNQCGRQQSVVATSGPYVIRFVYSVHYLVTLVTQSFFFCCFLIVYSGNYMGDPGARLLSKALQINTSLRALSNDRNSITVHGYSDIAYALERYAHNPIRFPTRYRLDTQLVPPFDVSSLTIRLCLFTSNRTLRCLSYPLHDIMVAAKTGTDKVDVLWKQIQEALQRNMSLAGPSPNGTPASVRLHQQGETANSVSSQNQLVDRLIMQVNEAIRSLQRQGSSEGRCGDIENARNLLSDAHAAKEVNMPTT